MENCDRSSLSRTRVGTFRGFHQVAVTVPAALMVADRQWDAQYGREAV